MSYTPKIVCIIPIKEDPTSFYRGVGPLTALQKIMPLELSFPDPFNWSVLKDKDILFMQRPFLPVHYDCLRLAKDLGVAVWCDFDDDNLAVPRRNPAFHQYNQQVVKESIVNLLRHSDVVTVSTEFLRKKYSIYNPKNTFVIPNAFDETLLKIRQIPDRAKEKLFLHRGSATHQDNLRVVEEKVIELSHKYPEWRWGFSGHEPHDLLEKLRMPQVFPGNHFIDYQRILCQINASCLYYPVADNDHSKSRSHVSWIEASFAGMATIASDTEEFKREGILNFTTKEEFYNVCESIIKGEIDISKNAALSWQCVMQNFTLRRINEYRKQIIEQILDQSAKFYCGM